MTVLQRRDARGSGAGSFRKFVVGVALGLLGVAAAFGISQVIDQEATTSVGAATPAERSAIDLARAQRAEAMHQSDRALIEKYKELGAQTKTSGEWTLEDELAAMKATVVSNSILDAESQTGPR